MLEVLGQESLRDFVEKRHHGKYYLTVGIYSDCMNIIWAYTLCSYNMHYNIV